MHQRAVHELAAGFYAPEVLMQWAGPVSLTKAERLYREAQDDGATQLVAEQDGAIAGFANLFSHRSEIAACYVAPARARRGIGSLLLGEMERIARGAGCDGLSLKASLNARAFYRAHSYIENGRGEHVFANGGRMAAIFMHKHFV